jgi:hypothetical protein
MDARSLLEHSAQYSQAMGALEPGALHGALAHAEAPGEPGLLGIPPPPPKPELQEAGH